jgi:thioredoxin reductase
MEQYPVIVIGAGPAGLAAGMQLNRQGISPLIFERSRVGGLLWNANWVENYPGFVDGITGPDLVRLFEDQAARLGVDVINHEVTKASISGNLFRIVTDEKQYQGSYLVAASGTKPNQLKMENVPKEVEDRIFTEVYPLLDLQNKHIVVVGAGDAALDYSINLSRHNRVTILNRGSHIKGLGLLWERVKRKTEISYFPDSTVVSAAMDQKGILVLQTQQANKEVEIECDFLLTAIGRKPNYGFADESIMENRESLVSSKRLFEIGDLINGSFRQTSIAVADGIRAAMIIGDLLEKS